MFNLIIAEYECLKGLPAFKRNCKGLECEIIFTEDFEKWFSETHELKLKRRGRMYIQNDIKWKSFEMTKNVTVGEFGCLLTSICNILVILGYDFNPLTLAKKLQENKGFDNQGNILWNVINNLFGLKENKYLPSSKILWSNLKNINYIVQLFYKNTGHFCNVLSVSGDIITYHDSFDDKTKQIDIKRVISIREVIKI